MDWANAVEAMKVGKHVQRASESGRKLLDDNADTPIYKCGMEPCFLAAAWAEHDSPTRVFCGSHSKMLFVPEHEHTNATDWSVVEP